MPKISVQEKEQILDIIMTDVNAIKKTISERATKLWSETRGGVEKELNERFKQQKQLTQIKSKEEKVQRIREESQKEIATLQEEITKLRGEILSENRLVTPEERQKAGLTEVFLGQNLHNLINFETAKVLMPRLPDLEKPSRLISEMADAAKREMLLCGNYEEAKAVYDRFYSFNFDEYGINIPRSLERIQAAQSSNGNGYKQLTTNLPELTLSELRVVYCPVCKASHGKPCRSLNNVAYKGARVHQERRERAIKVRQELMDQKARIEASN